MFKSKANAVGLEIDEKEIRMVMLEKAKQDASLVNWDNESLPEGVFHDGFIKDKDKLSQSLQTLWQRNNLDRKNKTVLGVSNMDVLLRIVRFGKPGSEEEMEKTAFNQAREHIPLDAKEAILDFAVLDDVKVEDKAFVNCLLVGAKRETMSKFTDLLLDNKINLIDIESSGLSLIRMTPRAYKDNIVMIFDMGYKAGNIVIIEKGVLRFFKFVRNDLNKQNASTSDIVDFLFSVIEQSIKYYEINSAGETVEKIVLSGYTAEKDGMVKEIQDKLNIPVEKIDPLEKIHVDESLKKIPDMCRYTVGISLARRAFSKGGATW